MVERDNLRQAIREEAREIPIVGDYDICVIGGSCTGVFAAVSAARLGARVAIVESNGFFGGVATASLICHWFNTNDTTDRKQIIAGLTIEVLERLKKRQASLVFEPSKMTEPSKVKLMRSRRYMFNTAELMIELDELVIEAGVQPFLHTRFVSPIMEDGKLVAIAIEDKTGRRGIKASYFVDATGDGDLIARMGLPFYKNEPVQPPSTLAIIRGLSKIKKSYPGFSLGQALGQAVFDPQYPNALTRKCFIDATKLPGSRDDSIMLGTQVYGGVDCSDADQLTKAEMEGRRQVRTVCDILRENFIADDLVPLVALSSVIGIRESRHARCLHTLTETEVLSGKRFCDAIANGSTPVDIHHIGKPGLTFRYLDGTEEYIVPSEPVRVSSWRDESSEDPTFYQIPYSSLVPQGATNVLVAGRVIDADVGAFGAVRGMVTCNQTGEAVGTASYLVLDGNISVAEVDTSKLREIMQKQGSIII